MSVLNAFEERFCIEYCVDLNAAKAYLRASAPSQPKGAKQSAHRLLGRIDVQARLAQLFEKREKLAWITVEKTEREIARMAYVDIADLFDDRNCLLPLRQMPEDARRAIVSVETEEIYDFSDEADDLTRLEEVEALISTLLGAAQTLKKGGIPEPLAFPLSQLERWAKPKKEGDRRKRFIGYTKKVKLADKKGANELAGKRDGLFKEKVEHSADSQTLEALVAASRKVTP